MKKIILITSLSILFIATFSFGQNKGTKANNTKVSLCNAVKDNDTIKFDDFINCAELHQPHKDWRIKSFEIPMKVNGAMMGYTNLGGKFSQASLGLLAMDKTKLKKLYIENVILQEIGGKKERKIRGIVVILKY